jgi:hypothetical protein
MAPLLRCLGATDSHSTPRAAEFSEAVARHAHEPGAGAQALRELCQMVQASLKHGIEGALPHAKSVSDLCDCGQRDLCRGSVRGNDELLRLLDTRGAKVGLAVVAMHAVVVHLRWQMRWHWYQRPLYVFQGCLCTLKRSSTLLRLGCCAASALIDDKLFNWPAGSTFDGVQMLFCHTL